MKIRKLHTNLGGRWCIEEKTLRLVILDVLKAQGDYFVDAHYITDKINEEYGEVISLARVRMVLNKMEKENEFIMRHSILDPRHKKHYSHPDNHPK